eukprot:8153019-Pyramimonas_sp.AAC.1
MALNAVYNTITYGFDHWILIMNDESECTKLRDLSGGELSTCAWQSGPIEGDPNDPYFKASKVGCQPWILQPPAASEALLPPAGSSRID